MSSPGSRSVESTNRVDASSYGGQDAGCSFPGFSPSPSPALSAYTCSSGSSISDLDPDIGHLSLDDWGLRRKVSSAKGNPSVSGTATPVASTLNGAGKGTVRSPASKTVFSQGEDGADEIILEEDLEENVEEGDGFDQIDEDEDDMHASGIPAARGWKLNACEQDTPKFRQKVIDMFSNELRLSGWKEADVHPALWPLCESDLHLKRVSGALTNAVFFVSYKPAKLPGSSDGKQVALPPTVLLRVYGVGSEVLLSRRGELLILHTLSSLYEIGPHILGTFANGRVEEYFKCEPVGKEGIRDLGTREESITKQGHLYVRGVEGTAQWIARRMRELHEVPLEVMRTVLERGDLQEPSEKGFGRGMQNHIMASSHRPRRGSTRTSRALTPSTEGNRTRRESSAPVSTPDSAQVCTSLTKIALDAATEQHLKDVDPWYEQSLSRFMMEKNGSVASFDSLATSFESRGSFSSISSDTMSSSITSTNSYFPSSQRASQSPITPIGRPNSTPSSGARRPYPGVWRRIKRWSREAAKVLQLFDDFASSSQGREACSRALKSAPEGIDVTNPGRITSDMLPPTGNNLCSTLLCIMAFDFPRLMREMDTFKKFIREFERREGQSRRVFAHNDSQYGNLLRISQPAGGEVVTPGASGMPRNTDSAQGSKPATKDEAAQSGNPSMNRARSQSRTPKPMQPHQQLVVIDFEYASPNPRAFDIANHFHEWRSDYHHPTLSWSLTHHGTYPDPQQRRKWLRAYVEQGRLLRMRGAPAKSPALDVPSDFSLGPPVVPVAKPYSQGPIPNRQASLPSHIAQQQKGASDGAHPSPSLTPFLRGQICPQTMMRSPTIGPEASPALLATYPTSLARLNASIEREVERLEREVNMWSPASHAVWGLWGIVFSRPVIESLIEKATQTGTQRQEEESAEEGFDYLKYALGRIELFRYESKDLGIL